MTNTNLTKNELMDYCKSDARNLGYVHAGSWSTDVLIDDLCHTNEELLAWGNDVREYLGDENYVYPDGTPEDKLPSKIFSEEDWKSINNEYEEGVRDYAQEKWGLRNLTPELVSKLGLLTPEGKSTGRVQEQREMAKEWAQKEYDADVKDAKTFGEIQWGNPLTVRVETSQHLAGEGEAITLDSDDLFEKGINMSDINMNEILSPLPIRYKDLDIKPNSEDPYGIRLFMVLEGTHNDIRDLNDIVNPQSEVDPYAD